MAFYLSLVKVCYGSESNISKVKVIAKSTEVKKLISGKNATALVSALIAPIQYIYENNDLADFEVIALDLVGTNIIAIEVI